MPTARSSRRTGAAVLLAALLALAAPGVARAESQVTVGHARFTVVTPNLVRMEYAPSGKFLDDKSWFAVNREARFEGAKVSRSGDVVAIETGAISLTYKDDGKPFSAENLSAHIKSGDHSVPWKPGTPNNGNLGGTIRTVDGVRRAVPLGEGVVSRDGWYLLDDSKSNLFTADWVRSRPNPENSDWYLFGYGTDYKAALKSLTTIGGAIPLPRKYALGIWYSRYWEFTTDEFKKIVEEYGQHGFPLDMMVMDMGWHLNDLPKDFPHKVNTWTGFTWDKKLIPDPAALIGWMHEHGIHVTLNDHPAEGIQPHEEMYADFMRAMGQDPASGKTIPFDAGSKKYLDAMYEYSHYPREKEGVDFWWLDWQQYPKTRSIPDLDNLRLLNWYNYTRAGGGGLRGQSFSRWAGWGDHRYPIEFSGDADSGWPMLAFEVPFTSTAGNVGAFFWSHDIGGHNGPRNEESYARWCQFGALSAVLRSHSTHDKLTDRRPWNYPDWAEASMKASFGLRSRLMPYLYTSIHQATENSVPFTRPMYMDYPTVEAAYHNGQEYMFGDNLLVAPIALPGVGPGRVASQAVWFPPGQDQWFDFFTGERFGGGESAVASAPVDQFPLFVRGGVPLPMQAWNPRPGTAPLESLVVRCYPGREGATGTSSLYEDDGQTTEYRQGRSATTALSYVRHGDTVTVTVAPTRGAYQGQPKSRGLVVELPNTRPGAKADAGAVTYDPASRVTTIELPVAAIAEQRTVNVTVAEVPPAEVAAAAVKAHVAGITGDAPAEASMAAAVAAARGVAILPVNQHPYGLGDDVQMTFLHNHQAGPETLTVTSADGASRTMTVTSGQGVARTAGADGSHVPTISRKVTVTGLPGDVGELGYVTSEPLPKELNLASKATATASTGDARPAIDGSIDGYPGDQRREWVTNGEKSNAWLQLAWKEPTRVSSVLLYDRPNGNDHVEAGVIEFSDGTKLDVPALPNDGASPAVIAFPARTVSWLKFRVVRVGRRTENIGLSEIVVLDGAPPAK